jgi:hypothetical protein
MSEYVNLQFHLCLTGNRVIMVLECGVRLLASVSEYATLQFRLLQNTHVSHTRHCHYERKLLLRLLKFISLVKWCL